MSVERINFVISKKQQETEMRRNFKQMGYSEAMIETAVYAREHGRIWVPSAIVHDASGVVRRCLLRMGLTYV